MYARVWGRPKATKHTKNASYRGGRAADWIFLTIPQPKAVAAYGLCGPAQAKLIKLWKRQTHTYCNKWPLEPRGSLLPCELKHLCSWSATNCTSLKCPQQQKLQDWPRGTGAPQFIWVSSSRQQHSPHPMAGRPLIGWGPPACASYHPTLNGRKASDWSRPIPCQQEGGKLPKGPYQSSNGYSTGVHLPGHLACDPSSQREARSRKFTGKGGRLCHTWHSPPGH